MLKMAHRRQTRLDVIVRVCLILAVVSIMIVMAAGPAIIQAITHSPIP